MKSTAVEEWKAEAKSEMLLEMLQAKFQQVPFDLREAVRAIKNVETLTGFVPLVVEAESLDAFRNASGL